MGRNPARGQAVKNLREEGCEVPGNLGTAIAAAGFIDGALDGHFAEPVGGVLGGLDGGEVAVEGEEDILSDLVGEGAVAEEVPADTEDHGLVAVDEAGEIESGLRRVFQSSHGWQLGEAFTGYINGYDAGWRRGGRFWEGGSGYDFRAILPGVPGACLLSDWVGGSCGGGGPAAGRRHIYGCGGTAGVEDRARDRDAPARGFCVGARRAGGADGSDDLPGQRVGGDICAPGGGGRGRDRHGEMPAGVPANAGAHGGKRQRGGERPGAGRRAVRGADAFHRVPRRLQE